VMRCGSKKMKAHGLRVQFVVTKHAFKEDEYM